MYSRAGFGESSICCVLRCGLASKLTTPTINLQVLLFLFAVSLLASILFGSIPAAQSSGLDLQLELVEGGRSTPSVRRQRIGSLLVICEVALTMVLLAVAGLLIQTEPTVLVKAEEARAHITEECRSGLSIFN
jgi:hypothetical protein